MKEFASALAKQHSVVSWSPVMRHTGVAEQWERTRLLSNPALVVTEFPLQRGYSHPLLEPVVRFEKSLLKRLKAKVDRPELSPLICTTPFYAPVAEGWPGPVIYYVTDMTKFYDGLNPAQIVALDRRMCRRADSVCANSARISAYLQSEAGCSVEKIGIVPNATRAANVALEPILRPQELPADLADLERPIAGVIGHLAKNMDWPLIAEAIEQNPQLTWVFVGPTECITDDKVQERARAWVVRHAHFIGSKPYGDLQKYARALDVAVLPYRKREPTYSGSSTRFYEHLAACRPMVATRGFAELEEKVPLIHLADTSGEMTNYLQRLHSDNYQDGLEARRWEASREGTWEQRVQTLTSTIN